MIPCEEKDDDEKICQLCDYYLYPVCKNLRLHAVCLCKTIQKMANETAAHVKKLSLAPCSGKQERINCEASFSQCRWLVCAFCSIYKNS
jgi:hypothetical protein